MGTHVSDCATFAPVPAQPDNPDLSRVFRPRLEHSLAVLPCNLQGHLDRPVLAAVVDDDHLVAAHAPRSPRFDVRARGEPDPARLEEFERRGDAVAEPELLVVGRDDDRQLERGGRVERRRELRKRVQIVRAGIVVGGGQVAERQRRRRPRTGREEPEQEDLQVVMSCGQSRANEVRTRVRNPLKSSRLEPPTTASAPAMVPLRLVRRRRSQDSRATRRVLSCCGVL